MKLTGNWTEQYGDKTKVHVYVFYCYEVTASWLNPTRFPETDNETI